MKNSLSVVESQRLIEVLKILKTKGVISNFADLSREFGERKTYFADFFYKGTKIKTNIAQKLYKKFGINEEYILTGVGDMLLESKKDSIIDSTNIVKLDSAAGRVTYKELLSMYVEAQKRIAVLEYQLEQAKGGCAATEGIA